jgi:hypothetical protein
MEERAEGERVLNAKKPPSPALTPEGDSSWWQLGKGAWRGKGGEILKLLVGIVVAIIQYIEDIRARGK